MENKNMTAVKWLLLHINIAGVPQGTGFNLDETIEKALQMEKEQLEDAWVRKFSQSRN